tara:strand:+ start:653 stop:934 length:282 start_codon:yes stop_codon:yes gene_type:complete
MGDWIITYFKGVTVYDEPVFNSKIICKLETKYLITELETLHNNYGYWIKHDKGWSLISNSNGMYFIMRKDIIIKNKKNNELNTSINMIMKSMI